MSVHIYIRTYTYTHTHTYTSGSRQRGILNPVILVIVLQLIRKLVINFCVINGYNPDLLEITWELPPEVSYCTREGRGGSRSRKKQRPGCFVVLPLRFSRTPLPIRGAIAHAACPHPLGPLYSPPTLNYSLFCKPRVRDRRSLPSCYLFQMKTVSLCHYRIKAIKIKFKRGISPFLALVFGVGFSMIWSIFAPE